MNTLPEAFGTRQLRQVILKEEGELAELDDQIGLLHGEMDPREERRLKLRTSISTHKASIHPIRSLSVELLLEIFRFCLPTSNFVKPDAKRAPLMLGQVCSRWRAIAFSAPELWRSIDIDLSTTGSFRGVSKSESKTWTIGDWLDRAQSLPLLMALNCPDPSLRELDLFLKFLLKSYAAHISELSIKAHAARLGYLFDQCGPLPKLRSLTIDVCPIHWTFEGIRSGAFVFPTKLFETAINLRRVRITSQAHETLSTHLPFTRLTHLSLFPQANMDVITNILRHCHDLLELSFGLHPKQPIIWSSISLLEPIMHSQLQYVGVELGWSQFPAVEEIAWLTDLLNILTVPSLLRFQLLRSYFPTMEFPILPQLLSFLTRSSGNLEEIELAGFSLPDREVAISELHRHAAVVICDKRKICR